MSASTVISDVTDTLRVLLSEGQAPEAAPFEVSLKSPAEEDIQQGSRALINVYLFRVMENEHQKNQRWIPESPRRLRYPPLSLNLFYVVTPFADDKNDEHRALGEAMRILYDNSIVTDPQLQGSLEQSGEELKIDLCRFDIEELTRIWNAFNKPYRLSVCYQVRIVAIDSLITRRTTRVGTHETQYGQQS